MRVVEATAAERADALAVREAVFVEEQGVDPDIEYDEHDETATHFVAYDADEAVGAARLRAYGPGVGKVERVAVLADRRGEGIGRALMAAVHEAARERGFGELYLHAQVRVAGFYERLGYEREGEVFEEAGIAHVAMRRGLSS